jgi:hypothetical protein
MNVRKVAAAVSIVLLAALGARFAWWMIRRGLDLRAGPNVVRPAEPQAVNVPRPRLEEGLFPMAQMRVSTGTVPEAFTRELPSGSTADPEEWDGYPTVHLRKRLCSGDRDTISRLERAVTGNGLSGEPDRLRNRYGHLLEYCGRPALCNWALKAVTRPGPLAEVASVGLVDCGAKAEPYFESAGAPAGPTIEFWSSRSWREGFKPRFVPRAAAALEAVAHQGDESLTRRGAMFLAEAPDPRSSAALLHLHSALPDGKARDEVAAAMGRLSDPAARAIFRAYCARPEQRDPVCGPIDDFGLKAVAGPSETPAPAPDPALARRLRESGLLWRGPLDDGGNPLPSPGATAAEILTATGPVHCFDVETGQYPNEHDGLLYDLAELAGPPLAEAVFEEEPPPIEVEHGRWLYKGREMTSLPPEVRLGQPYVLRAHLAGQVYETDAQDLGDWYDLDQVLALLNAVAAHRQSDVRLATLPTGDQTACVIAAPAKVLRAAVQSGLLKVESAGKAAEAGKGFEAEVLRQLTNGR